MCFGHGFLPLDNKELFPSILGPTTDQEGSISSHEIYKDDEPKILIKANVSTTVVQDVEAEDALLESKQLSQLESEFSQAVSPLSEVEDVNSD